MKNEIFLNNNKILIGIVIKFQRSLLIKSFQIHMIYRNALL